MVILSYKMSNVAKPHSSSLSQSGLIGIIGIYINRLDFLQILLRPYIKAMMTLGLVLRNTPSFHWANTTGDIYTVEAEPIDFFLPIQKFFKKWYHMSSLNFLLAVYFPTLVNSTWFNLGDKFTPCHLGLIFVVSSEWMNYLTIFFRWPFTTHIKLLDYKVFITIPMMINSLVPFDILVTEYIFQNNLLLDHLPP